MLQFLARRLLITIPLLFLASIITFLLVANLGIPQQLENAMAKPNASPAAIQSLRSQFELDTPLFTRYTHWVSHFARGDFGQTGQRKNVRTDIWRAIQVTLRLLVFAQIMAVVLGIIVGLISAIRQYTAFDYITTGMAFLFFSIPTAVLAGFLKVYGIVEFNRWARHPSMSAFMLVFMLALGALCGFAVIRNRTRFSERAQPKRLLMGAAAGIGLALGAVLVFKFVWDGNIYRKGNPKPLIATIGQAGDHLSNSFFARMQDYFWHLLGPSLTLILVGFAGYSRYMRASMLDTMNSDYVRTARSKGVSEARVIMKHAFRNALIPLTTAVALDFGALLSGAIITERIFAWKGMGTFFSDALNLKEPKPLMAFVMVTALMVVLFNVIADVLYARLDPRIRLD
jgi:peptide/nickel transport system permease protein